LGGFQGIANTSSTQSALNATVLPRNIASAPHSGVRFLGGAIFPRLSAPPIALWRAPGPLWGSVIELCAAAVLLICGYRLLPATQRQRGRIFSRIATSAPAHTH